LTGANAGATVEKPGQASRALAHRVLGGVLGQRRPLDEVLAEAFATAEAREPMERRDRAFARLLVATVLRRLGHIDAALTRFLERPLPPQAAGAWDALRLGAAQLLYLGTPPHAAVDGAVTLVADQPVYRGLVNAVLRKLVRDGAGQLGGEDPHRLATPAWLWDSWVAAFGEPQAREIVEAHWREPALDLTVKEDAPYWAARLNAEAVGKCTVRLREASAIEEIPGFDSGAWWVQDAAAAMPALALGGVKDACVIDLGAAPGGKTAQLAAAGARVTAVDRSKRRLNRLRENLARLKLQAEVVAGDAGVWRPAVLADAVLLDAPCTATGTIRRHPDVLHLKSPADLAAMTALQDRLLDNAWAMLKPGGTLVYCTCSLQPEEGAARVERLLASGAPLARAPIAAHEVGAPPEAITLAGDVRTLPCHWKEAGGLDGFFIARLRRI
jgi:16S rRNA (cytosine967-C5)-methyltransferase